LNDQTSRLHSNKKLKIELESRNHLSAILLQEPMGNYVLNEIEKLANTR